MRAVEPPRCRCAAGARTAPARGIAGPISGAAGRGVRREHHANRPEPLMMRSASAQSRQGRAASSRLQGILEKNGVVGSKLLAAFASENFAPAVDHVELRRVPAQVVPRAPFPPPPLPRSSSWSRHPLRSWPCRFSQPRSRLGRGPRPAALTIPCRGPRPALAGVRCRTAARTGGGSPCPMQHACCPVCFTAPHRPGCQSARQWTSGTLRNGAECLPLQLIRGEPRPWLVTGPHPSDAARDLAVRAGRLLFYTYP